MEPMVVQLMLQNSPGDCGHVRVAVRHESFRPPRTGAAINHVEPIGNRGAGKEIWAVEKAPTMRKVVHYAFTVW